MEPLGILAGEGALPRIAAESALAKGRPVIVLALTHRAWLDLHGSYTIAKVIAPHRTRRCVEFLREREVRDLLIIGKVSKLWAISQVPMLDGYGRHYLAKMADFQDNTFHSVLQELVRDAGMTLVKQGEFLEELLAVPGTHGQRVPSDAEQADIDYGYDMARRASELEVSQTVVVKDRAVMALEACEGTDATVARGCKLARRGAVVVKVSWARQLESFDLPTVGPRTIARIAKHKGSVLAVEAGRTFLVDKDRMARMADRQGIAIVAR